MNDPQNCGIVQLWHRRLLGVVWALGGLFCIFDVHRPYWWEQHQAWLPVLVGLTYLIVGVGFARGWTLACFVMGILVAVAALIFAYCIFMAGWLGNRLLLHWMLVALGFALYTGGSILVELITRGLDPFE